MKIITREEYKEYLKEQRKTAQIKPIKKSQIPIQDWDLVNELNDNKVQISLRYL